MDAVSRTGKSGLLSLCSRYGHVSRSSGLVKTILQGTVKWGRRQGRQKKRWEDSIREWTGLEFAKSQRAVEDTEKWRKLVAKSSVMHQQPPQLADGWRWRWNWPMYYHSPWLIKSLFSNCCMKYHFPIDPLNRRALTDPWSLYSFPDCPKNFFSSETGTQNHCSHLD